MIRIMPLLILLSLVACSFASEKRICTEKEAIQAESEADMQNDWDSLYTSFKRFAHCDDAAISEGYSGSVSRLLAYDWKQFKRLQQLVKSDRKFERFILKHIAGTVPPEDLKTILENARMHCPPGAERLCKSIGDAAGAVLKEEE
jgi:hypothetical protein